MSMKIRADFVTNSSSSSFVTVTFNLKNKEETQCGFEERWWDEYPMPVYCEGKPINGEGSNKGCNEKNNVCCMAELLDRILQCMDTEFCVEGDLPEDIDYPQELFPLFVDACRDEAKAKELYETMCLKYSWFKDIYPGYDDDFVPWVRETFLGYPIDELLDATKDIDSLADISGIKVTYYERNWVSCFEPWMREISV